MSETQIDPKISLFFTRLAALRPGERARFKRNAGKSLAESQQGTMGLFYRTLPSDVARYQEETYFLTATLYPLADDGGKGSFGHALRRARQSDNTAGLDRRIEILLDADESQLPFRLRQALRYLAAKQVRVNWSGLLTDLLNWQNPQRFVQERWARDYFTDTQESAN
jgi:CRISPR system Cascade subunit CasB